MTTSKKPLLVYKASAGSGKTFTLAVEYIKLLVENPQSYKTILAVTFTNKATEEMKMRILSQLYGIWKQLDDSNDYTTAVCKALDASPQFVSRQAGTALHLLLHNYNYFRVETIDSFFQSVMRNLARELDLTANLRIGLNDVQVEEQAVDRIIEELNHTDIVLQWIMKYILDNINDDKGWNVIGQIKKFGQTIFRDYYKQTAKKLNDEIHRKGFFDRYTETLQEVRDAAAATMKNYADRFFDIIADEGLTIDDFYRKEKGVAGMFAKMRNGNFDEKIVNSYVNECYDGPEKGWYSKSSQKKDIIHSLVIDSLDTLFRNAVAARPVQWRMYKSAILTLRHLNQLRLLDTIETKVRAINDEENRFLLSDTPGMLHALINNSDAPFIFEKIGTQLEHVMIDEFQDTSTTQWENFKVLLNECMSHANTSNLIVGDVKQSIYRWRSGDWRLLNNIESQFASAEQTVEVKALDTNYRSQRRIIEFNNCFFRTAAEIEYADQNTLFEEGAIELQKAYADVEQEIPEQRDNCGMVSVSLLADKDYADTTVAGVLDIVGMLLDKGVSQSDIAILVRNNSHIPIIANAFAQQMPDVSIVSGEAFRLDASVSVNMIIAALRLIIHPDDMLSEAELKKNYMYAVCRSEMNETEMLASVQLPGQFTDNRQRLASLPLYDLVEEIYSIFSLSAIEGQSSYVCAFYDQLSLFTADKASDIELFLREWDENICRKTVPGDELDGVRLLSIHKSKGLEFDNVIIPFADWQLEKTNGNVLWCSTSEQPFGELPLVPIDYGRQMIGTVYEHDYLQEHLQNCVDNLNLLYVAFTRAGNNLFIIGKREARGSRSMLIEQCLPMVAEKIEEAQFEYDDNADMALRFEYGNLYVPPADAADGSYTQNVFKAQVKPVNIAIESFDSKVEFRQSNQSRDFVGEDTMSEEDSERQRYIKMGSILHQIFSTIRTADDIDQALLQMQLDGVIYDDIITADRLAKMLRERLTNSKVAEWFSPRWQLFNECTILKRDTVTGEVVERRPDRVMTDGKIVIVVDFKFGSPKPEYHEQVREYVNLLADMGYNDIRGYLWYVYSNKIEEVKFNS